VIGRLNRAWQRLPDEVRLFARLAPYALIVGTIYWFVSYELAGTVLLIGFGLATGLAFLVMWRTSRRLPEVPLAEAPSRPDGPFGDERGPVPTRSAAPLVVGFGLAVMALGGAFGPWFALVGIVPVILGGVDWLRAARRELDLRASADADRHP